MEDYTITDRYNEYCYNQFYEKSRDWDKEDEIWAEKEDREWEDLEC